MHFFTYCSADHRALHSFPTRRSSDLETLKTAMRQMDKICRGAQRDPSTLLRSSFLMSTVGSTSARSDALLKEFAARSEEHTSELQSHSDLVCRLLLEKKK